MDGVWNNLCQAINAPGKGEQKETQCDCTHYKWVASNIATEKGGRKKILKGRKYKRELQAH